MGHLMERLLRVIGLDRLCDRIGIAGALLRGGIKADPSYIIGHITYWLIVIFATTASLGALDVSPINEDHDRHGGSWFESHQLLC